MRRLPQPAFDEAQVYEDCVFDLVGAAVGTAYSAANPELMARAGQYRLQASNGSLHTLPSSGWGHDEQIVAGALTKGDLTKLYDRGLLRGARGRSYYDKLLASAPLGKCPYCHFGHAETLDHFLSKARYPSFAVLPVNLIPACMRCNKGKAGGGLTAEGEISHPYFELQQIEQDAWLVAHIVQTTPATAQYALAIPANWPAVLARRVTNYFSEFDLAARYAVEAASEMVSVSAYLRALPSPAVRREHLQRVAAEERRISTNGWKTALYAALAASDWYCAAVA